MGHLPIRRALENTLALRRTIGQGEKVSFYQALALIPCNPAITVLSQSVRSLNQCALVNTAISPSLRSRIHHIQCCSRIQCAYNHSARSMATMMATTPLHNHNYTTYTALSPPLRHCAPYPRCPHIICPLHSLHCLYPVCAPLCCIHCVFCTVCIHCVLCVCCIRYTSPTPLHPLHTLVCTHGALTELQRRMLEAGSGSVCATM